MKDRLVGMMGTLGLVLVLSAAMPTAGAFAFGGSGGGGGGCTGGCGSDTTVPNRVTCTGIGDTCAGTGCGCTQTMTACPC
jgi:hypothetical protein